MSRMVPARTLVLRWVLPVAFAAISSFPLGMQAQNGSAQAQQGTALNPDYTRREIQPDLNVDRDPVPSPDVESNAPLLPPKPGSSIAKSGKNLYTLEENVNEVVLNCTVVDEQGRLVKGLAQRDFQVWEDGTPQTIASFRNQDVPVSMGILVDNSGSMRDKRASADSAALDLVRLSNPQDNAFIVNFNQNAYLDQGFTSNISDLEQGLSHYDATGTTAIYDAVAASADELSKYARWPKQVLLIITDGDDNASRLTLQQAVERVQRLGGPVVYSIGLLYNSENSQEAARAKAALETLSNDTGGLAFFPTSPDQVNAIAAQVAMDIRNQYTIGYHPTRPPSEGGYRTVRVVAHDRRYGRLVVRTTKGYYPKNIPQMHADETAQAIQH